MSERWADAQTGLGDRRRAMLVTNSYDDAAVVAAALATALDRSGCSDWKVHCLVRERSGEDGGGMDGVRMARARPMPRSLVERFELEPERSVLEAPMQIVARGHNILNEARKAGISVIHFFPRPHPRPDDLGPNIDRLNRTQERFDKGVRPPQDFDGTR
ncbi:hypothetical protein [Methylobacterium sp. B1]|uniref:hypothetical protein n=1 Tax=Methylobacterium sp. B1 TaxID=91459 RepID=UPI00034AE099|nr:hypothetical protein [Methylobacterium sp. B1]